jgi:hypothetical protein
MGIRVTAKFKDYIDKNKATGFGNKSRAPVHHSHLNPAMVQK